MVYRNKVPKSCEDCTKEQRFRSDPDLCFFVDQLPYDKCPFTIMNNNMLLADIYSFCAMAVEKQEKTEEMQSAGPAPLHQGGKARQKPKGPKKVEYYVSIEKFNWACSLYNVPKDKYMEALEWASFFSSKATEAPKSAMQELRRDRWG